MTVLKVKPRLPIITTLIVIVLGAWILAFVFARTRRPAPTLDGLEPLLKARNFDAVERRLHEFLKSDPNNIRGNMLRAQVALDREDQDPDLALESLAKIRPLNPAMTAVIRLNEGKAFSALSRYDKAEAAWIEALRLDPLVPEAGWAVLGLYYVQGRREEAHKLGLALHASEPDPRDRVQLLLELLRQDAQPLSADSVITTLEPVVREHPEDLHSTAALGLAWIRHSRPEQGLKVLRPLIDRFGNYPEAWDALLTGLAEAFQFDELTMTLGRLPQAMSKDPRFERHRGVVAQNKRDWPAAADAFLLAWQRDPSDAPVLYKLSRMLRAAGRVEEAERFDPRVKAMEAAREEAFPLFETVNTDPAFGSVPRVTIYQRLADLRERMGREDEALAWHRLVLKAEPEDAISLEAIRRLPEAAKPPTLAEYLGAHR
ncbi:tetratricopeptide repeat protein [Singulisphaera sp. PoT]|uniref:tetratricopeptide repeat protein n=1 Tax=Singulisphaera sp. PoT TaxID=3411797 RepID=UPI003BF5A8A9